MTNNNELAKQLIDKFNTKFDKMVSKFMEPLDNNTIKLCEYKDYKSTIDDDLEREIGDIIQTINYLKILRSKEIDAVLDTIEYIDHNDTIINAQRDKYCKLTFYFENPIPRTQKITWGKNSIVIYLPAKDQSRYVTFRHPITPEKYEVGRKYTLIKVGYNQWRIKE